MLQKQLRARGIADSRVLDAMSAMPRHLFVPRVLSTLAYEDRPLPIGHGQTISQPFIVAEMLEALSLTGTERVLDVGTGSGYQAALLGLLAREVWSVDIVPELAEEARARLQSLGAANVEVLVSDGSVGLSSHAPFDAIVVAAAAPHVPVTLVDQLAPRGRLVIPVGTRELQKLLLVERTAFAPGAATTRTLLDCAFVPLLGTMGFSPSAEDRIESG
jgi:protein-L-isoaspartate(D-aspartate) O-methyltransferase